MIQSWFRTIRGSPRRPTTNQIASTGSEPKALDAVSISVEEGTVHALVGENGAGKSTLGKIIAGSVPPDVGEILVDSEPVSFRSPREALAAGIAAIARELLVVPRLSVAENVFLGAEPQRAGWVSRGSLRRRLHEIIRSLTKAGKSVLLVSHFLREVLELADTVTVLRDGKLVHTKPTAEETEASLIQAMLGRPLDAAFPAKPSLPADAPVALSVRELSAPGVSGASLEVGAIVGLAGFIGPARARNVVSCMIRPGRCSPRPAPEVA